MSQPNPPTEFRLESGARGIFYFFAALLAVLGPLVVIAGRPFHVWYLLWWAFAWAIAIELYRVGSARLRIRREGLTVRDVWHTTEVGWDEYAGLEVRRQAWNGFRPYPYVIRKDRRPVQAIALVAGFTVAQQRRHVASVAQVIERARPGGSESPE